MMEFRAQMLAEGGSPGPPCRGMPNRAAYLRQVAQPSMLQHETACWPGYTDLILLPLHSKIITIYQL